MHEYNTIMEMQYHVHKLILYFHDDIISYLCIVSLYTAEY